MNMWDESVNVDVNVNVVFTRRGVLGNYDCFVPSRFVSLFPDRYPLITSKRFHQPRFNIKLAGVKDLQPSSAKPIQSGLTLLSTGIIRQTSQKCDAVCTPYSAPRLDGCG
jgi:hypothetical protein